MDEAGLAYAAGLRSNDRLLQIGTVPVEDMSLEGLEGNKCILYPPGPEFYTGPGLKSFLLFFF